MYTWRKLTELQRSRVLQQRKDKSLPWHRPPHFEFAGPTTFIITAACFEHFRIVGKDEIRIAEFEHTVLSACSEAGANVYAWCVLPNHYHLLVNAAEIKRLRKEIGYAHGRTARLWNKEDGKSGRKVWYNYFDRNVKSDRHYWASLNYIHHNAVHHGYVDKWQDWPFSSAHQYLNDVGREEAARIWREYPILDYGKGWDIY